MYNIEVIRVNTLRTLGKIKAGPHGYYRKKDEKKAYITIKGNVDPFL